MKIFLMMLKLEVKTTFFIDEIIDRVNKDRERQCYFDCGDNMIERVDTSIEYSCQNYILEEK